jgi:hypothetical protein
MKKFTTKDSGKRITFEETGMNRDVSEDKVRYDLVVPEDSKDNMLQRWAALMTRGAVKYGVRNWEKARTADELLRFRESAFRHFMQWYLGEDDEDHAAAAFFNIQGAEYAKRRMRKGAIAK